MAQTEDEPQAGGPPPEGHALGATIPVATVTPRQSPAERIARATLGNPVLVKEFRTRMRGSRTYWLLLAYTLLLSGVVGLMYFGFESGMAARGDAASLEANSQGARELGRSIYFFVFIAQAIMIALITPALTSGGVTIEREQRSYELLVTTPLRPADLIRGKLTAAVMFVLLLLTASLPLVSLSFLVGGVSPGEISCSYLVLGVSAFLYGTVGIFWSATLRTTAAATVITYLTVLSLFVVSMFPWMAGSSSGGPGTAASVPFQSLNPVAATFRAVQPEYFFGIELPSCIAGAVLNLLAGMLLGNLAMGRLEHFDPPPAWTTRLLCTLLWGAFALFFFGPVFGGTMRGVTGVQALNDTLAWILGMMLVMLALAAPVFNTGDLVVRRGESALGRYLRGFLPSRAFGQDLSNGFPLVMAWGLFLLALVPIGAAATGKGALFGRSEFFVPAAILSLAVSFGLAGTGHFLSVTLPSRWAACILTYLFGIVAMVLPYFTRVPWDQALVKPTTPQPVWQLLYLVPFEAIAELGNAASFWTDHPPMLFGRSVPIWLVTSALYLLLGLGGFLFTAFRVQQEGRRLQQRLEAGETAYQPAPA